MNNVALIIVNLTDDAGSIINFFLYYTGELFSFKRTAAVPLPSLNHITSPYFSMQNIPCQAKTASLCFAPSKAMPYQRQLGNINKIFCLREH